ncbi:hypothetical protein [Methylobacterium sp. J-076]|uniref:hypothetical protein n=1 Tax=Methylobacterium sp. J-076 TaxID=2836655 RepID=UPI001FB9BF4B|nr:hypothetical protein [Methylobacterium sp. J-076]MCJ2013054.1 hypothetical protein [Methylobacterium sp. J-076]
MLIATTDAGIPAMMVSIPQEIGHGKPILVESSSLGKVDGKVVKVEFSQIVNPMICSDTCKYMFPLDPKIVYILNAGEGVHIFAPPKEPVGRGVGKKKPTKPPPQVRELTISGRGFAASLAESTKVW